MSESQQAGLPLRDAGVPCGNCGSTMRRPTSNHCGACGRFAPDPVYAYSRLTDTYYRVTEYDDLGNGHIRAKEKEAVKPSEVPTAWREALGGEADD